MPTSPTTPFPDTRAPRRIPALLTAMVLILAACATAPGRPVGAPEARVPALPADVPTGGDGAPRIEVLGNNRVAQIIGDYDFLGCFDDSGRFNFDVCADSIQPTPTLTATTAGLEFTDLGFPFEYEGSTWLLFGDSEPKPDEYHDDAMARITGTGPEDLSLEFVTDPTDPSRFRNPFIRCDENGRVNDDCYDLDALNVPVTGLGDGSDMYVWFTVDQAQKSVLTRSTDGGITFDRVYELSTGHFIHVTAVPAPGPVPGLMEDDWVLLFGSGVAPYGDVYVAAMPMDSLRQGDRSAIRYLAGIHLDGPRPELDWSTTEDDAVPIFEINHGQSLFLDANEGLTTFSFGEPLLTWSPAANMWFATHQTGYEKAWILAAPHWWGPWSEPAVLFDPAVDYGDGAAFGRWIAGGPEVPEPERGLVYAPAIVDRFTEVNGDGTVTLYHVMSTWNPYTVVLMKARVRVTP